MSSVTRLNSNEVSQISRVVTNENFVCVRKFIFTRSLILS